MEKDSPTDPTASGADSADQLERELALLLGREEPPPAPEAATATRGATRAKPPRDPATKRSRSGSQNRKRFRMVTSAYDEDEFKELDEAASRAGLTRASFQRVQSLATPKTRSTRRPPIDGEMLAKVSAQLGKIGSNLNQIAHSAHLGIGAELQLNGAIKELRATLPVMCEALGRKA
jgi:hypothetical protein